MKCTETQSTLIFSELLQMTGNGNAAIEKALNGSKYITLTILESMTVAH